MKKILLLAAAALTLCTTPSMAGFVTKKHATSVAAERFVSNEAPTVTNAAAADEAPAAQVQEHASKQTIVSRVMHKLAKASAEIPKVLYIVMSIVALGWLAMGINGDFEDWDWVIALLLSILWLPGVIYSLIKMKKYYK